jgi:aryl carrier-like protein
MKPYFQTKTSIIERDVVRIGNYLYIRDKNVMWMVAHEYDNTFSVVRTPHELWKHIKVMRLLATLSRRIKNDERNEVRIAEHQNSIGYARDSIREAAAELRQWRALGYAVDYATVSQSPFIGTHRYAEVQGLIKEWKPFGEEKSNE